MRERLEEEGGQAFNDQKIVNTRPPGIVGYPCTQGVRVLSRDVRN
jgi:hypothetical protein